MLEVETLFHNNTISPENGYNIDIESMIRTIDSESRLNNKSTFIIDFDNQKLIYISKRLLYMDEVTDKDKKRDCENPYWSLISNDTLNKLLLIHEKYQFVKKEMSDKEFMDHICIIDYPISLHNHELFITQKFTPITFRRDGITKIGMFTVCHSNKTNMECIIINPSGRRYLFDFNERRFVEKNIATTLSTVERAILHRARMGIRDGPKTLHVYQYRKNASYEYFQETTSQQYC